MLSMDLEKKGEVYSHINMSYKDGQMEINRLDNNIILSFYLINSSHTTV